MDDRRSDEGWMVFPIGVIRSPFTSHTGTPVQPALAGDDAQGTVEVFEPFAEGLADTEGFERIWLICWLDRAGPVRMKVVPYLDTTERGLFATRAPSRPNPIGISAVRLLRREGHLLHVSQLDLLDGTPLLDIKPYAPAIDVFPIGRGGWLADRISPGNRTADGRFEPPSP
jgi:tRNA-Thr(GGU) m(6)t(6)A37 methyltransferase TsaA